VEQSIREYVDEIFSETAPTRKSVELKEEMIQNLQDKYNDLISEGKTPEAAYNIVIAGIGDLSALLRELDSDEAPDSAEREEFRRKSAMFTAIAVAMYIVSILPVILIGGRYGMVTMIAMAAIATGLLVYNSIVRPSSDNDDDEDSMVADFREWRSGNHERRSMMKAIFSALWAITVAIYIIISFSTGAWHITWIIFLIAGAIQSLITAFISHRAGERKTPVIAISSALWTVVVAIYFVISFSTGAWHVTWVIFLVAGAVQSLLRAFLTLKK